jgi:magnesium/cobalt transport protein CorA
MQILSFAPKQPSVICAELATAPTDGFYWLDIERNEIDWANQVQSWLGISIHEHHVTDSFNEHHPPFYDSTDDYDMLAMRTWNPQSSVEAPTTQTVILFITEKAIISIRPPGHPVFVPVTERLLKGHNKQSFSLAMLFYLLLDRIINSLLNRRDGIAELLSDWQMSLLDKENAFKEWRSLMQLRIHLRRLEAMSEAQQDEFANWRQQTNLKIDENLTVRFNDLEEHLGRVLQSTIVLQHNIDALIQIYFSVASQRTNKILQLLTIVSVIFLPLNLIAGLFGMNFEYMPFLHHPLGAWMIFGVMIVIVLFMLWLLERHKWL